MTLWNVAVLALILGALGGVVRYKVQADLFATVDRTLAERAHEFGRRYAAGPPNAGRNTRARQHLLGAGRPHPYRTDQCAVLNAGVTPTEYRAGIEHAIAKGWLWRHESGVYVEFTPAGAELFA